MSTSPTITIVGGGLAGLSLGIGLRKAGVPAHIFEAGKYPRHRVCGEFLTGLDDGTIETLGIGPGFAGAKAHRSITWFKNEKLLGRNPLPSPARSISRYTLEARLVQIFTAAGGLLSTLTRCALTNDEGWVWTVGRKRATISPWLGLKLHAKNFRITDELEFHLGSDAYVGMSQVEDGWTNICGLFRRRRELQFHHLDALPTYLRASGLDALSERLAAAEIRPGSQTAVAGFTFDRNISAESGVRLGDACAMIPPFTGNGMAMAFESAALALQPLVDWTRGNRSWNGTALGIRESLKQKFRTRLNVAAGLHPFLLSGIGQRVLETLSANGLLPFRTMYQLLH